MREPDFVNFSDGELLVQFDETEQMIFDTFAGVIGTGAGAQDERPIAGLREEQFARGLFENGLFLNILRERNHASIFL